MYRIEVKFGKSWKVGHISYHSLESAKTRQAELAKLQIKSRVILENTLWM